MQSLTRIACAPVAFQVLRTHRRRLPSREGENNYPCGDDQHGVGSHLGRRPSTSVRYATIDAGGPSRCSMSLPNIANSGPPTFDGFASTNVNMDNKSKHFNPSFSMHFGRARADHFGRSQLHWTHRGAGWDVTGKCLGGSALAADGGWAA